MTAQSKLGKRIEELAREYKEAEEALKGYKYAKKPTPTWYIGLGGFSESPESQELSALEKKYNSAIDALKTEGIQIEEKINIPILSAHNNGKQAVEETCSEEVIAMVNELIRESFGKKWKGNVRYWWDITYTLDHLEEITRREFPGLTFKSAGKFLEIDGSSLEVRKKYEKQAAKYARLYEARTGKKVTIKFWDESSTYRLTNGNEDLS